jgi:hypothetical protein
MQQKDLKIHIEKSFRFCKSENVEKEFTQLKTYIQLLNKKKRNLY